MAASDSIRLERIIKEYVRKVETTNPGIKENFNKLIKEFYGRDRAADDPGYVPVKPWAGSSNVARENVLTYLNSKPFRNGLNPHGYQLDVTVKNPEGGNVSKQDRLWFYDNGTVYSTNQARSLYYRANKQNQIEIYTDDAGRDAANKEEYFAGDITKQGNTAIYNLAGAEPKEKEQSTWDKTEDVIHTILDWIGVIPGIGDIVDLVNGVWYLIDAMTEDDPWLYLEAFLSFIAVIPIIGSGIKMTLKGAFNLAAAGTKGFMKLLKRSMKLGNAADTYKLWESILRNGNFSKMDLKSLGNGLDSIADAFTKTQGYLPADIYKSLDNFADWSKDSKKAIDELTKLGVDKAAKQASSLGALNKTVGATADVATTGVETLAKVVPIPTTKITGLLKRFRRTGILPEDKILKVAKGLENRFIDEMTTDPARLTVLLKQTKNSRNLIDSLKGIDGADTIVKKYFEKTITNSAGKQVTVLKNVDEIPAKQIGDMFGELEKLGTGEWKRVQKYAGEHAIQNNSWIWNGYRTNSLKELQTVLSKRYMGGEGLRGLIPNKGDARAFRKWVDVVYNELQDAGEDISKQEIQDNPTGVIYPILKYGLEKTLPGTAQSIQSYRDAAVENPVVKAGMGMLGVGVTKDGELKQLKNIDYDPFGEAGGKLK